MAGGCHKYHFCRDKAFVASNAFLSQQNSQQTHVRRDKGFVVTSLLSLRQTPVCRDKTRDDVFGRDKSMLAATKIILLAAPANDSKRTNKSMSSVAVKGQRPRRSRPTDSLGCQSHRVQDGRGTDHACGGHLRRPQHDHRRPEASDGGGIGSLVVSG